MKSNNAHVIDKAVLDIIPLNGSRTLLEFSPRCERIRPSEQNYASILFSTQIATYLILPH